MSFRVPAPEELSADQRDRLNSLVDAMKVVHIEVVSFSGQRVRPGPAPNSTFQVTIGAGMRDERLVYRFDVAATLNGKDGKEVGKVDVALAATFEMPPEFEPQAWLIERLGGTAVHIAFPHLRENIQSLAARLGYLGVLMPVLVVEGKVESDVADVAEELHEAGTAGRPQRHRRSSSPTAAGGSVPWPLGTTSHGPALVPARRWAPCHTVPTGRARRHTVPTRAASVSPGTRRVRPTGGARAPGHA